MVNRILIICMCSIVVACSSIDKNAPISNIEFEHSGMNKANRPDMASVCKGFILTTQHVVEFYMHAETIREPDQMEKADILPCYSSGTAYLYGKKHTWTILYGGIGIFKNGDDTFFKICGKHCCKKVKNIC